MASGLLDDGGGVVQRGAMMVVGPVFVAARLQQASRGEGLVGLVRMSERKWMEGCRACGAYYTMTTEIRPD